MVTGGGFNALLKLVEEPPPHLKFVFATTEPEKVIPTIRSRTHHYPFRLLAPGVLRELLEEILASEDVKYEPAVLPVVIRAGAGSARDSLSILDQLLAGSGDEGLTYDGPSPCSALPTRACSMRSPRRSQRRRGRRLPRRGPGRRERPRPPPVCHRPARPPARPDRAQRGAGRGGHRAARRPGRRARAAARADGKVRPGPAHQGGPGRQRRPGGDARGDVAPAAARAHVRPGAAARGRPGELAMLARLETLERRTSGAAEAGTAARGRPAPGPRRQGARSRGAAPCRPAALRARRAPRAQGRPTAHRRPPALRDDGRAPRAGPPQRADSPASRQHPAGPGQANEPSARPPSSTGRATADSMRERWPEVLDAVRRESNVTWILLGNATVDSLTDGVLTLKFAKEGEAKGFTGSGRDEDLSRALQSIFGAAPQIRATAGGSGASSPDQPGRTAPGRLRRLSGDRARCGRGPTAPNRRGSRPGPASRRPRRPGAGPAAAAASGPAIFPMTAARMSQGRAARTVAANR